MKHGIKQRKLSRSTGHRRALLRYVTLLKMISHGVTNFCVRLRLDRNLVSALLHHEQITTTVAKAAEAQKVAEKVRHWKTRPNSLGTGH